MNLYLLNNKWTKTDQIAKLHEFTFFHRVACESKHGWCVRHLKHHSNLSPTNARSMFIWNQPPYQSYQSNTTSFEDSGLNLFYKSLSYKGFYFRDKLAHLCSFRPRRSLQEVKVWPRSRRWGESGTIGARFEGWLWSILEVGRLKWPSGDPCDSIKFAPWVGMLPPKPEALPTQSIYPTTLVRDRGTFLDIWYVKLI